MFRFATLNRTLTVLPYWLGIALPHHVIMSIVDAKFFTKFFLLAAVQGTCQTFSVGP